MQQAGRLRHWITLERLVESQDSDGAMVEEWEPAFAVSSRMPADISPMSGKELISAQAVQSVVSHRIRIRHRDGVVPKMRATYRGVTYNIEAVIPDMDSGIRWMTLLASSGLNAG